MFGEIYEIAKFPPWILCPEKPLNNLKPQFRENDSFLTECSHCGFGSHIFSAADVLEDAF